MNDFTSYPIRIFRNGWDWRGLTDRTDYVGSYIWMLVAQLAVTFFWTDTHGLTFAKILTILFLSISLVPMMGHALRRVRHIGWSGWLGFLLVVPVVGFLFRTLILFPKGRLPNVAGRLIGIGYGITALVSVLLLLRLVFTPFWIPAGSMKPALLAGDYIIASRLTSKPLRRGDVLVFEHPMQNAIWVKRLIGLPGDTLSFSANGVTMNGAPLPRTRLADFEEYFDYQGPARTLPICKSAVGIGGMCNKQQWQEQLPNGRAYSVLQLDRETPVTDMGPYTVPDEHFMVLGDNRDNSFDSRYGADRGGLGMVPAENILYRANVILFSSAGAQLFAFWKWRPGRYLQAIR